MRNIDFWNIEPLHNTSVDIWNKNPGTRDIDKLLWDKLSTSEQIIASVENSYREDIEFKSWVGRCMATFEGYEWRDLSMCLAYLDNALDKNSV